jgi:hypothetical protein
VDSVKRIIAHMFTRADNFVHKVDMISLGRTTGLLRMQTLPPKADISYQGTVKEFERMNDATNSNLRSGLWIKLSSPTMKRITSDSLACNNVSRLN